MKTNNTFRAAAFAALALASTFGALAAEKKNSITFHLVPNPAFASCLADNSGISPSATVTVTRGNLNDTLTIATQHIKHGLSFDLFTVQHSNLLYNGLPDPNFQNFGMAWYQSDLETGTNGTGTATIHTILLDQIFGFDAGVPLAPVNTFHVGFWFNSPTAAAACGFNAGMPTPFNGEHKAGPVAMISVPNAQTKLGPLCTDPNTSTSPATCNP